MTKKALIIACTYRGKNKPLHNSYYNATIIRDLARQNGYSYRLYTEEEGTYPSKSNITGIGLAWLVSGARNGDELLFYFSGHGGVHDGVRCVFPSDYQYQPTWRNYNNVLSSYDLQNCLVNPLPAGCTMTAIFQSCKSGNILNLKHTYEVPSQIKYEAPRISRGSRCRADVTCWASANEEASSTSSGISNFTSVFSSAVGGDGWTFHKILDFILNDIGMEDLDQTAEVSSSYRLDEEAYFSL